MANEVGLIENTSLWWREVNIPGPLKLLEVENTAMNEFTLGGLPTVTPQFNRNGDGQFVKMFESSAAPGDQSTTGITYRVWLSRRHPLYKILVEQQREIYLQRAWFSCPPVTDRVLMEHLEHYRVKATGGTKAASTDLAASAGSQNNVLNLSVSEDVEVFNNSLSVVTISETGDIFCIAGMGQNNDCLPGYPGADRLLFIGAEADGAPANGYYSVNGGGAWAAFGTDPTPFAVNSSLTGVAVGFINRTQIRVFYIRAGDGATKAQWAYQDFPFNAATLTAASWNVVTVAATANGDDGEAIFWYRAESRLYVALEGDIFVSEDNGESDPGAAVAAIGAALAGFIEHNGDIWAFGAGGEIHVERSYNRDVFVARTAPNSDAITALAFAADGTLFAGIGTSLYKSNDEAGSAGGWTSLKDFGTSHAVKSIRPMRGSSMVLQVEVDDATPGAGEVWRTYDGGQTWVQITALTNTGYNAVYYPNDLDQAIIVGDGGVIHLLS